ncbi:MULTISPECIES: DUF2892 domain-containing protein [unclassified Haloferax]|uniref:YgaP family membrane protein n=1 Tax=unclassified Haloferax TaxID=2625095 RepID=UPI002875193E|nr:MULTISPECIES: DUF2892 domain-containing protein [unclassified Haloferax]MDS0243813.1 DUF2892 domain-containing protein [Haloferax sp. S2CR25]MDS0446934.1 DUF2892 domain-containing protein [Haloferax sp. S2CR25-2]
MERNVGGLDRTARLIIGVVLALVGGAALLGYWTVGTVIGAIVLLIGAILLVTGTTQKCPINEAAGIDTTE